MQCKKCGTQDFTIRDGLGSSVSQPIACEKCGEVACWNCVGHFKDHTGVTLLYCPYCEAKESMVRVSEVSKRVDSTWLVEQVTLAELDHTDWGQMRGEWSEFREQISEGDELWKYGTPPALQRPLELEAGFALKRGDRIVATIITIQS